MRKIHCKILLLLLFLSLAACGNKPAEEHRAVADSLSLQLSDCRYKDAVRLNALAGELLAMDASEEYNAIAKTAQAHSAVMRMDYHSAKNLYNEVRDGSQCEIERLVADVGLMTICYRVSANRSFFDYRSDALQRIRRITEEEAYLPMSDKKRFVRAKVEFGVVSLCYFSGIGLNEEAQEAREYLARELEECDDIALRFYARMMLAGFEPDLEKRLDLYAAGVNFTQNRGPAWLAGNYKLLLAINLRGAEGLLPLPQGLQAAVGQYNPVDNSPNSLALLLAADAGADFSRYGDDYMKVEALSVQASCNTQQGLYNEAITLLDSAVAAVNSYYKKYAAGILPLSLDTVIYLDDSEPDLQDAAAIDIPECLLSIRREASCAYAGLGNKPLSDINREAYLDLLRNTRLNKQMESRMEAATSTATKFYWWVLLVVLAFVLLVVFLYLMNRRWSARNAAHTSSLKRLLHLSHSLMSSLPRELESENEVLDAVCTILADGFKGFSGDMLFSLAGEFTPSGSHPFVCDFPLPAIADGRTYTLYIASERSLDKEQAGVVEMALPYVSVAIEEGLRIADILDEQLRLQEQRVSHELYLAEYKRENLLKRVSLSVLGGMRPYMDRILNELNHLSQEERVSERRLQYVAELADKLNDYNLILERWIKMRQGELNLLVEKFSVREIFDIIEKSTPYFEARGIALTVKKDDAVVRADRALTLFMVNTLVENAGKFTPSGGRIVVEAAEGDGYVELSVTDSGIGLSREDIERILGAKVYDAALIGDAAEPLSKNKGGGFGLMNCKGIIEKYRKTDEIFSVCRMDISSDRGRGSRFSFRLPSGVRRLATLLFAIVLPFGALADDSLLERAGVYADSVFLSNVNGDYASAREYAGEAIAAINSYYKAVVGGADTLSVSGGTAHELAWWREGLFHPSLTEDIFFNILDVRNELAVAALATQQWNDYRYNNGIYVSLYRLVHEDRGLDTHYYNMQQLANYRLVAIALLLFLIVLMVAAYLMYYVRHGVIGPMNSRMVLNLNRRLLGVASGLQGRRLADDMLSEIYSALGETMCIERVSIMLKNNSGEVFVASLPDKEVRIVEKAYMQSVCESGEPCIAGEKQLLALPLFVNVAGEKHISGALELVSGRPFSDNEILNIELVAQYAASVAYHSMVRMAERYKNLATVEEETERVRFEEHRLHVQNMVMDNCLSVIKHETLYYPSRLRMLVENTLNQTDNPALCKENISAMRELMDYYMSVFGILSNCATKQLDDINLHCVQIPLGEKFKEIQRLAERKAKKNSAPVTLSVVPTELEACCDDVMLTYLLESLLDGAMSHPAEGELLLRAVDCGDAVRVELLDKRQTLSKEALSLIFVPSKKNITPAGLVGMEFLVAKEIVRLHEDNLLQRGGRIEASCTRDGTVYLFTLPKRNIL